MATDSSSDDLVGCIALPVLGLAAWLTYDNFPISAVCIGAGVAALCLRHAAKMVAANGGERLPFRRRLALGLATDGKRAAFWLFVGFALVWAVQIVLNLFRSNVDPHQILSAELGLYEFAENAKALATVPVAVACLAAAALASMLLWAWWPLAALGLGRKLLGRAIVAFAAITSISFVAIGEASNRYDFAAAPIRAGIVQGLASLAQARRERAAFEWMTAQFNPARAEARPAILAWQDYFAQAATDCAREDRAFRAAYAGQLRQTYMAAPPESRDRAFLTFLDGIRQVPAYCRPDDLVQQLGARWAPAIGDEPAASYRSWLPDYAAYLGPPTPAASDMYVDPAVGGLTLYVPTWRLADLGLLQARIRGALRREETARHAARTIAVEAVAGLLPGSAHGAAGAVLDAWKEALVEVLAGEGAARIRQRLALLKARIEGRIPAPASDILLATPSPIASPLNAPEPQSAARSSIDQAIHIDMAGLARPAPGIAGREAAAEGPGRAPSLGGYRPHPQPRPPPLEPPRPIPHPIVRGR